MQNKKKLVSRVLLLMMVDAMIITIAGPLAIYLRYNFLWEAQAIVFIENIFQYLPLNFLLSITIFWMCRLYQGIWKYASASDLANILLGCFLSALTQLIGMKLLGLPFPRSYPFMYFAILSAGITRNAESRKAQYYDRGSRRSGIYAFEGTAEQPFYRAECVLHRR